MTLEKDLARIRRDPTSPTLDKLVENELHQLELAGRLYQFHVEPRCRVCKDDDIRRSVNKMLAFGMSYRDILEALKPVNSTRAKNSKISYDSIYTHRTKHFILQDAAAGVLRHIMEKEAEAHNLDYIRGVGSQLTVFSYLKSLEAKGYANLTDAATKITPELGMQASLKYHELTKEDADVQAVAKLYSDFNTLLTAVKEVVAPEDWAAIITKVESKESEALGIIDVEVDEDYDEDNQPFNPATDADETTTDEEA